MENCNKCENCSCSISRKNRIQLSFAGDSDLEVIKKQLEEVKKKYPSSEFWHLFLPRHIIEEKNLSTCIVDLLDEVLGEDQVVYAKDVLNFAEFMGKLEENRKSLSTKVDRTIVLGTTLADGIKKEINIASQGNIIIW